MDREAFGRALRSARKEDSLTVRELSRRSGIDERSIRHIESGVCPSVALGDELARALRRKLVLGDGRSRKRMEVES